MAGNRFVASKESIALTAATAKTCLMLTAASNVGLKINRIKIGFDSATSTNQPALVEYVRPTSAGTFTSLTPVKDDPANNDTLQLTAGHTASAEPTIGSSDVMQRFHMPVYQGLYDDRLGFGAEIPVPGGGRWGIRITSPSAVNVSITVLGEE